jgi:hypothetical protein
MSERASVPNAFPIEVNHIGLLLNAEVIDRAQQICCECLSSHRRAGENAEGQERLSPPGDENVQ